MFTSPRRILKKQVTWHHRFASTFIHPRNLLMACLLANSLFSACASAPPPPPPPPPKEPEIPCVPVEERLEVRLLPSADLNLDREGQPRSVQLRIYQLRNALSFRAASFEDLWFGDGRVVLGDSLVTDAPEFTVIPGQAVSIPLERHKEGAWLGVAAQFRTHATGGSWQQATPLPRQTDDCIPHIGDTPPIRRLTVTVGLSEYSIHPFVGRETERTGA